jgi:hypothetical protein
VLERTGFHHPTAMLKVIFLSAAIGVIALSAAVPLVSVGSTTLAEPGAMLVTATAFFCLAAAMRWQGKGARRPRPTGPPPRVSLVVPPADFS